MGPMQTQILGRFSGQPKVYHLANQALTVSHTFVQRLITFIDSTYNNLCHVSRFQEKQSWALTMTLVDRILADLFAPKSGVYIVLKVQEREDACFQLLWARHHAFWMQCWGMQDAPRRVGRNSRSRPLLDHMHEPPIIIGIRVCALLCGVVTCIRCPILCLKFRRASPSGQKKCMSLPSLLASPPFSQVLPLAGSQHP